METPNFLGFWWAYIALGLIVSKSCIKLFIFLLRLRHRPAHWLKCNWIILVVIKWMCSQTCYWNRNHTQSITSYRVLLGLFGFKEIIQKPCGSGFDIINQTYQYIQGDVPFAAQLLVLISKPGRKFSPNQNNNHPIEKMTSSVPTVVLQLITRSPENIRPCFQVRLESKGLWRIHRKSDLLKVCFLLELFFSPTTELIEAYNKGCQAKWLYNCND